jgi:hypothetical protein
LDYGCGLGVWDKDKIYDKQIFLYDKNKLLMKLIKKNILVIKISEYLIINLIKKFA